MTILTTYSTTIRRTFRLISPTSSTLHIYFFIFYLFPCPDFYFSPVSPEQITRLNESRHHRRPGANAGSGGGHSERHRYFEFSHCHVRLFWSFANRKALSRQAGARAGEIPACATKDSGGLRRKGVVQWTDRFGSVRISLDLLYYCFFEEHHHIRSRWALVAGLGWVFGMCVCMYVTVVVDWWWLVA